MQEVLKFSNIDVFDCKKYLNIEEEFIEDDELIQLCIYVAQEYVIKYTSISIEELDKMNSSILAVLVLVNEFYSKRSATVENNNKFNFMLKCILDINRKWM